MKKLTRIPVFFSKKMVSRSSGQYSQSAIKPAEAVESWKSLGPIEILAPVPVSEEELCLVHDPQYIWGVMDGELPNGFGVCSKKDAASFPYTTGSMLSAAIRAMDNGKVAVAPCSGFHHAGFDRAAGFCTFNGLMVTAKVLKRDKLARKVGILDFDQHYGDGTEDLIKGLKASTWIKHFSAGQYYHSAEDVPGFMTDIPKIVAWMADCDVILYQAGADPHVNDPLGGWLTTTQLFKRDQLVFEHAHALGVPVAWNLAGGYQTPLSRVLKIHDNTMRACMSEYLTEPKE